MATVPRAVTERIHPRALSVNERQDVLEVVNSQRFRDQAPGEVYATLLDEGRYLCSERTIYRILAEHQQVRERRDQIRHPGYQAPRVHRQSAQRGVVVGYYQANGASEVDVFYL